jgi:hypothetical protein
MPLKWIIFSIALAMAYGPGRLPAQEITTVLGGRAEITVPPGFRRDAGAGGADRFYLMRFVDLLASEYPHVPSGKSQIQQELRAIFDFEEFPLTPEARSVATPRSRKSINSMVSEIEKNGIRGIWCPFVSNPNEIGIFAGMHDPETDFSHCFGGIGAAIYLICKKFPDVVLCVSGIDMVEIAKVERAGWYGFDESWTDAQLLEVLKGAGNVAVLEAVLKGFRYC